MNKKIRITLLFNANKAYDRQVIQGIGEYLQASQYAWDVFLEEDFLTNLDNFKNWQGDGVIADFDDSEIRELLSNSSIPTIGVGGSYSDQNNYPNVPYIATDNEALIKMAFKHLKDKGLENFAFYGLPETKSNFWAQERERAFNNILKQEGYAGSIYRGNETNPQTWQYDMNRLADWLQRLSTPTGIIAVNDSRARHILQACEMVNLIVPDKVAVIGIDNEELTRYLTRVSLSSVGQSCKEIGYLAAKKLHKLLTYHESGNINSIENMKKSRTLLPPNKIYERQSTDFQALKDPYVIQAMHFIRHNAYKGIKVDQVLDHIGISRSNLEIRFKDECGHSIHQEIHNAKLRKACHLLKHSDLPIIEVANLCGYPSLQYMYSVFKKHLYKTPKEYRKTMST